MSNQNDTTAHIVTERTPAIKESPMPLSIFADIKTFGDAQRMAQLLASSDIIPDTFKGNVANCTIAIEMSQRMQASPFAVMQNLYIVHGKPSWSAVFIIASINASGRFSPLRYTLEGSGKTRSCYAWALDLRNGNERLEGPKVTWAMATAEGWVQKKGSKWMTMPDVMFTYRSAAFFGKSYCPELLMGMQTTEEMNDIIDLKPATDGTFTQQRSGVEGALDKVNASNEKSQNDKGGSVEIISVSGTTEQQVDLETGEILPEKYHADADQVVVNEGNTTPAVSHETLKKRASQEKVKEPAKSKKEELF